jgi:rifampicin phosphotransferase
VIDSRGFIPRPPVPLGGKGEYIGVGVSSGVVRGRIKVLHAPDEKPLEKGEILVARATDPGWTPLFVNVGGVILEIGGLLQHGALVAREYGLPCVAGIENATTLWQDGTLVEVDGSAGVVRVVSPN